MKKNYLNEITIILISYQSFTKIKKFIRSVSKKFKIIIIENSKEKSLLKIKNKNIKVYMKNNKGISSSLNYACKMTKTKYFFHFSPDISIKNDDIKKIYEKAKKLKDNFAAIGPRFINVNAKSHKQSNIKKELSKIKAIHGSAMFINKKNYTKIGKFDENFFLFYEENDFCKRGNDLSLYSYQLNTVKIKNNSNGSIKFRNKKNKENIKKIYNWHFIWSKYYYIKKHYGLILAIIYFTPIMLRILYRLIVYSIFANTKINKYKTRLNGLISSMMGKKSFLRPE